MQWAVSVGTMQLTLSIAVMQVPTSVAIMQVLKFYCNYVGGGTFCYTYVGGSFCCNDAGVCFCCNLQLEDSAAFIQVKVFVANMWVTSFIEIMQVGVCCNHAGSIFYSALCT